MVKLDQLGIMVNCEEEECLTYLGAIVDNGIFGVKKKGKPVIMPDGEFLHRLRLICHFVPSNSCMRRIDADIDTLASEGAWNLMTIRRMCILLLSTRDRQCFFYCFGLPPQWRGYSPFAKGSNGLSAIDQAQLTLARNGIQPVSFLWNRLEN